MTDSQLQWTDDQWSTIQRVAQDAARKARVASSFLPLVGPLPDSLSTVPSERMDLGALGDPVRGESSERLVVHDADVLHLTTTSVEVYLKAADVADPDLAVARQMVGRAATVLARLEDAIVFNGQPAPHEPPVVPGGDANSLPPIFRVHGGQAIGGLVGEPVTWAGSGDGLVPAVAAAIQELERAGHYGPFAAVFGTGLFTRAVTPDAGSLVLPMDRIVPLLDGPLLRSGVVPDDRGVVVALAGDPVQLVVAKDIHVRFLQVTLEPRWVLRVSQRFVLRQRQLGAVATIGYEAPAAGAEPAAPRSGR
jgi:uncharacterized linocin/CFP29 family protein